MATMTATIFKSTASKSNSVLDKYQPLSPSQSHPNYSNLSFPYVTYKKDLSLTGPIIDPHKSSSLNSTEAFILKSNLILRSSSLYDNSNYHKSPQLAHKYSHSDFESSMLAKAPVINSLLPRVEIAKVSRAEASNKSMGHDPKGNRENVDRSRRLLEKLSKDEFQQLSRLLYKHFSNRKNAAMNQPDPVPVDYNEEDPQTWPSNWLSQAPSMILEPDKYLAQKPMLNSYQRQLIRRISLKYEPLVQQYLQQLMAHRVSQQVSDTLDGARRQNRLPSGEEIAERGVGSSLARLTKPKQHPSSMSMVKSASLSSSLSSQVRIDSINNVNNSMDNNAELSYCHKEAGTLLSSTCIKPEVGASPNGGNITSRGGKSIDDNNSGSRPSKGDLRQSSPETPLVSSSRSPKLSEQNRLSRLSAMHLNKWSSKMKVYLRKN